MAQIKMENIVQLIFNAEEDFLILTVNTFS